MRDQSVEEARQDAAAGLDRLRELKESGRVADVEARALAISRECFGADVAFYLTVARRQRTIVRFDGASDDVRHALTVTHPETGGALLEDWSGQPFAVDLRDPGVPVTALANTLADLGFAVAWGIPVEAAGRLAGAIGLLWRDRPKSDFEPDLMARAGRVVGSALETAQLREAVANGASSSALRDEWAHLAGVIVSQIDEAIVVTATDRRITSFNPAAERQYGIIAADAVGRPFDDLIASSTLAGDALGDTVWVTVARTGRWHGRVLHRPLAGARSGETLVVDAELTALRDESGQQLGIIGVIRDVTAAARLDRELASLAELAVETGQARTVDDVARTAVDRLIEIANADAAAIILFQGEGLELVAHRGLRDDAVAAIAASSREPARVGLRIREPGRIVNVDLEDAGLEGNLPAVMRSAGLEAATFTGLHVRGVPTGYVALAWTRRDARTLGDAVILQAAGQVAVAIASARLTRETADALDRERRLSDLIQSLVELTLLPADPEHGEPPARVLLQRVIDALGGAGGYVGEVVDGGLRVVEVVNPQSPLHESLLRRRPDEFHFWRSLVEGAPAFFRSYESDLVPLETRHLAVASGLTSHAAFPLRDGDRLTGALVVLFRKPFGSVLVDDQSIDAVGRIVSIAASNLRLTERLGEAYRLERELADELQTLQDLTLLGSTAPDMETLARETTRRIMAAVGAAGGAYTVVDATTNRFTTVFAEGVDRELEGCLTSGPASPPGSILCFEEGQSTFVRQAAEMRQVDAECARAADAGLVAMGGVALRVSGLLAGIVRLEWRASADGSNDNPPPEPGRRLEAASHIVSISLANFRLRQELVGRMAAERAQGQRMIALHELTRVGEASTTSRDLARRTSVLVRAALGARAVAYGWLTADDGFDMLGSDGDFGPMGSLLEFIRPSEAPAIVGQRAGSGPALLDYVEGQATEAGLRLAAAAGIRSYALIPVRLEGELAAVIFAVFDVPVAGLPIEIAALDSVSQLTSISLDNFRLRDHLVSSESRYRTLFEESIDAIRLDSPDGTIVDVNEAGMRLFGGSREELVGLPWRTLIAEHGGRVDEAERALEATGRASLRATARRLDGSEFTADVEVRTVEIEGSPLRLVLTRDVSETERIQAELMQAQKMEALGQLVAGTAHELSNPLTAIMSFAQLLHTDVRLPGDMRHDAELLVEESRRTNRIVQGLLDYARQRPPERQLVSLREVARSVLDLQSYPLWKNHIEAHLDVAPSVPLVEADRAQIQQVLLNLTLNSIQAIGTADDGRSTRHLTIEAHPKRGSEPPSVLLTVTDDGPGIPPRVRDKIFNPFFTTKEPGSGTGLGLSVTRGLVEGHAGSIWYEPGPGGTGSRFVIELPVVAPEDQRRRSPVDESRVPSEVAGPATGPDPIPSGSWRPQVLILDDEPMIRDVARRVLGAAGMDSHVAASGPAALKLLDTVTFDVLLVDHRMAGMSGTEFVAAATAALPDLGRRTIFMSGDVLNDELHDFAESHGVGILSKPFENDQLVTAVRTVLQREGRAEDGPSGSAGSAAEGTKPD